ncbi:unnamed protein product, partial [marine sediment metagenome]
MHSLEKVVKGLAYSGIIGLAVAGSSCSVDGVKPRLGSYASATVATNFQGLNDLGSHNSVLEGSGQLYTCKAGHIDLAHLRKSADWTRYFTNKTFEHLMEGDKEFSFKMKEPSKYFVKLDYPDNWADLSFRDRKQIANDVSINLGQYFTYTGVTWHEMITWFGYKSLGFYPEFPSSFSWEDGFSNFLGVYLAGKVLKDNVGDFDKSMTLALEEELIKLDVQPANVSKKAAEKVKGKWYSGDFLSVDMKKRNFSTGIDGGMIVPWIIPDVCECEGKEPQKYQLPDFGISKYGFSMKLEIEQVIRKLNQGRIQA